MEAIKCIQHVFVLLVYIYRFMAAEGKAIIFFRCNLLIFYVTSMHKRTATGSQPNLASRSKVV